MMPCCHLGVSVYAWVNVGYFKPLCTDLRFNALYAESAVHFQMNYRDRVEINLIRFSLQKKVEKFVSKVTS